MSLPKNMDNQMGSGSRISSLIIPNPAAISRHLPLNYNPRSFAFMNYSNPVGFGGIPTPDTTPFRLPHCVILYEFYDQPAAANRYNLMNSSGPNFAGLLNDGNHNNFLSYQPNWFCFGTFEPVPPLVPFLSARASYNYEGSGTQIPTGTSSSSISLRGRRRLREKPHSPSVRPLHELLAGRENTRGKHKCLECGRTFKSGPALGGHVSHHTKRRREEYEIESRIPGVEADP